jgi:hypothetical protein
LPTNDHFSSSWTSRVRGGKSHELVVSVVGAGAGGAGHPDDGIAMDADEPPGLADAAALVEVGEHGAGRLVGEPAVEQGRALALGEAGLAGVAVEQADVVVLAVAVADRQVAGAAAAVGGAVGVLAAKAGEVVHGSEPSWERRETGI